MPFVYIGFILTSILIFIIYQRKYGKYSNLPPGPPSLPIFGSFPLLNREKGNSDATLHKSFHKLYPDMYTLWLGSRPFIVIQDFNLAKDLFSREEFCGRPSNYHDKYIRGKNGHNLGIVAATGSFWQEQRRFTLKHLKDLGFGRQKLDAIIQDETKDLIEDIIIKSKQGDVLFDTIFNFPIINILWQIVASKKYEPDHPESKKMMDKVTEFFQTGIPSLLFLWTVAKLRDLIGYPLFRMDQLTLDLKTMFRSQVLEHSKEFTSGGFYEPRNFIDIYLKEIKERQMSQNQAGVNSKDNYSSFNTEQLATICLDFFQAGSETSSTTLSWAVLYLTLYPDVQNKCWLEINENLGDRLPTKDDISTLIYCAATIQEVQRVSCVAPASLFHSTTKDVEVKGYKIPEETLMVANISKFMMDPDVFPKPDELIPERFIESDGDKFQLKKINQFVPFGLGKRICAGESLAVSELFIFFVMLVQRLKFNVPLSHSAPDVENYFAGFTRIPKPFHVSVIPR